MPFGTQWHEGGGVRFRLYAPDAGRVELCLEVSQERRSFTDMKALSNGWHEIFLEEASPGDLYRFRINGDLLVPDPASRFQPADVHGPSEVIDPGAFQWEDVRWKGRPWEEVVLYELHVGTFTEKGSFEGVCEKLDYLAGLGITAVELMPLSDFPGKRNWGYDGVLPFAPDSVYGRPEDLKRLVQEAHMRGLMVFLDVVYNHFGPEGNYLHTYAQKAFFTDRHETPWGAAINFDGPGSDPVREFFIHNALYWINEYHMDGLRLDAVHAIADDSRPDILQELAQRVREETEPGRHVHLVLENDDNAARYLERDDRGKPVYYVAQWNDDIHHAFHVLLTGEKEGYYADYAPRPADHLVRCLVDGFDYQGEPSGHRGGARRGEPSGHLPLTAFVSFVQNHDQVGNRAFGDRLGKLAHAQAIGAAVAVMLLAPSIPLLFMGEEYGCSNPFPFFCHFGPELAAKVTDGRRNEFASFPAFQDPQTLGNIPDPNARETFEQAVLNWQDITVPEHGEWLAFYQRLLGLRHRNVFHRLKNLQGNSGRVLMVEDTAFRIQWTLGDGSTMEVLSNLGDETREFSPRSFSQHLLFETPQGAAQAHSKGWIPPWSTVWRSSFRPEPPTLPHAKA